MEQVSYAQLDTFVSNAGFTAGSSSTLTAMGSASMRGAAAAARTLLLNMASAQLGVPAGSLAVSKGVVSGGGKSVTYASLMSGKLFNSTIAAVNPTLTSPGNYKLIGTRVPRIDIPSIVTGRTTYIQNVRIPGMLHGRVVRPRGQAAVNQGATVVSIDKSSISHIPNVQVVQKGNFLGVVAPKEYDAIQAAAQLKVTWDNTPMLPGSGNLNSALRNPANLQSAALVANTGNVGAGLASAAKTVSASYFNAYNLHGALGPNASVAVVTPTSATIFCTCPGAVLPHAALGCAGAWPPREGRASRGLSGLGHLRTQHLHRCEHLGGSAFSGRRQAGASAVHALGRAWLGPVRTAPGHRHPGWHRRKRQHRCLQLHVLSAWLDAGDRIGNPVGRSRTDPSCRTDGQRGHGQLRIHVQDSELPGDEQERRWLQRVPEGNLDARTGSTTGRVRLRADDRRTGECGEHGPDRIPDPEHRLPPRQPGSRAGSAR